MSIVDWIESTCRAGVGRGSGQLLEVAYKIEYGAESERAELAQHAVPARLHRARARCGSSASRTRSTTCGAATTRSPTALAAALRAIVSGSQLAAIRSHARPTARWTLGFVHGHAARRRVGRTGSCWRSRSRSCARSVDYSKRRLRAAQGARRSASSAIGTNSKFHLQFTDRIWEAQGKTGETFSDRGYQNTWEVTRGTAGRRGHPRRLHRRRHRRQLRHGHGRGRMRRCSSTQIEPVIPGLTARVERPRHGRPLAGLPLDRGSYSYWKVGQYTRSPASSASRGHLPLRRRAHLDRLPGLPQRRRRNRPASRSRDPRRSK